MFNKKQQQNNSWHHNVAVKKDAKEAYTYVKQKFSVQMCVLQNASLG